jgi:D-serine deaminase-like pyridoxal phosphate-dependent protein
MEPEIMDLGLPFKLAAYIMGTVISTASGYVILDAGRRSVSYEYGLPVCLNPAGEVKKLNDEHAVLEWKGNLPPLGFRVALRPTQNRTTFNLYDNIWLVEEDNIANKLPVKARGLSH